MVNGGALLTPHYHRRGVLISDAERDRGGSGYGLDDAFQREGGRELGRQGRRIFEWGNNRPPTLTAESGDIFLVQVTAPLVFPGPYNDGSEEGSEYALVD